MACEWRDGEWGVRGEACPFISCLGRLTVDHTPLSRRRMGGVVVAVFVADKLLYTPPKKLL